MRLFVLVFAVVLALLSAAGASADRKKVVFLAGTKSHGPGEHEYEKGLRLLARCLRESPNLIGFQTEVHLYGWPEDPRTLDDADTIVLYSDGSDRDEQAHPLLVGSRLEVIGRQMRRGAGLVLLHYSTFAPVKRGGPQYLEWVGGHFDYETGTAPNRWLSRIQFAETTPYPATPKHPIARGISPFRLREEWYFNMRFAQSDRRRVPILKTAIPGVAEDQTVAWAIQRRDGGRGFAFTGGHLHSNWQVEGLRRMVLNAIVWTARAEVPAGGVQSTVAPDQDAIRALILTGHNHPAHDWRATTRALREELGRDGRMRLTVWEDPERMASEDLSGFDLLVLNYQNWERPTLSAAARERFARYVREGGGLVLVHFANGTWNDWPEFAGRISRRYWVEGKGTHDPFGTFRVRVRRPDHLLTRGLADFDTTDELYCGMPGDLPVDPLLTGQSIVTKREEPLAYACTYGRGRVFQTLLGHSVEGIRAPAHAEILRRAAAWAAGREVLPLTVDGRAVVWTPNPVVSGGIPARNPRDVAWPFVGGDRGGTRHSPLAQINRKNVGRLAVAWTYRTGDADPKANTTIECTPIMVDGILYLTTARCDVVALEAATGREIWRYRTGAPGVNRGVAYWTDGTSRRVLVSLQDGNLYSLDALTGRPDPEFGEGGIVDLRRGMTPDLSRHSYGSSSAPAVFEDLVILGFVSTEAGPGAPGTLRAFDVRSGRERWRFNTVPQPGEWGHDTWPGESWKDRAGANAWGGFTVDEKNGLVFCGTGSAASDFYGADRPGPNLFANCTLALDARTGRRLWHFQTVRHDLWDRDNPCPPVLVTVKRNGRAVEAVAQVTKTGYCYVLDRTTGAPLFPVEDRPAPPSDVPGERASPAQPIPVRPPPFARQQFTEAEATDITPESRAAVLAQLKGLRHGGAWEPPSLRGSVITPGFHGGATWSGASWDPESGLLFVNSNNTPWVATLVPDSTLGYNITGYHYFKDPLGYPAIRPPWGLLTAIDLNRGEFAWQSVLGEFPELRARGIPPTGTENFGGTIVTAGGLVFIGGTKDERFRAFDSRTGRVLWEHPLPAGGYATPCTYSAGGRQFVVIACGGGGKLGTPSGDSYIAFALPR